VTERLGIELWRFQHALRATLDSALLGSGLSFSEYCVLELVRTQSGITASSLAEQVFITRQALGRTIARLHDADLLSASPGAGHSRPLRSTPRGDALLADVQTVILDAHGHLFAPLTTEERLSLIEMISRCSQANTSSASGQGTP
jgi:DNA-binding MarR family transcriptional regulator